MSDINKVIMVGRLAKQPELRYTQQGTPVATFTLATSKTFTVNGEKKETVAFVRCTAWSKKGEAICQYVKKGHRLGIEGRISQSSWEDSQGNKRSALEVIVENFQFLQPTDSAPSTEQQNDNYEDWPENQPPFPDNSPLPFDEDMV